MDTDELSVALSFFNPGSGHDITIQVDNKRDIPYAKRFIILCYGTPDRIIDNSLYFSGTKLNITTVLDTVAGEKLEADQLFYVGDKTKEEIEEYDC